MATVKGQNLRVFINNVVVAAATQCDLSIRLNVKTQTTKDDVEDWGNATVVNLSWEVRAQGLVTIDPTRNDPATLMDRIGQTVRLELGTASGEKNSVLNSLLLAGDAIISDVQLSAPNQDDSTYNVTFTGKSNMLTDIRLVVTSDGHYIRTTNENLVAARHE